MRRVQSVIFALVMASMLSALAGCGGNDSTAASNKGSPADGAITRAELIKRGDAICRKTDEIQKKALAAYEKKHGNAVAFGDVEKALVRAALPPIRTEIDELATLGAPSGDELQIEIILTGFEKALKAAEAHPNTLLGTGEGEFATPDKLAGIYGFKDCAKAL
jgi:hypothetical protein